MAVTVAGKNYTQISGCESISDGGTWTTLNTQDSVNKKQGTYSLCGTMKNSGLSTATFTPTASVDMSGTKHLRMWFLDSAAGLLDTKANGGIQLGVTDGVNTGYWNLGGKDTYSGGWLNLVIDVSKAVDVGTKPTSMNAITVIYLRITQTAAGKNFDNIWGDNLCLCDGLTVYGDDAGSYFDFDNIFSADDATLGIGIIRDIGGIKYLTGSLEFGDSAGVNGCKFQAKSQVVVFEDRPVNADLYDIIIVDNGTGTTEFILGAKSGTAGIQGCAIRVEDTSQTAKFDIDANTDTDVDNFKMYASSFYGADEIKFANAAATVEVLGCSFEKCGQVDPDDAVTVDCFFIDTSNVDAALLWNENINIQTCNFIANTTGAGIEMPSAVGTPYAYNGHLFSGNTYDVLNSSGSAISINKNNGSNPTTSEGSAVTFLGVSVTTKFTVIDSDTKAVIENVAVLVTAKDGTGPLPFEDSVTISRSGDVATVSHTAHGLTTGQKVEIIGANQDEYNRVKTITVTGVNGYTYAVYGSPATPATGTIKSTGVLINGLTNVSGEVSDTRALSSDQPYTGSAKKGNSSPVYKDSSLTGTVDKDSGISVTVAMIAD